MPNGSEASKSCSVWFRGPDGQIWSHTTQANALFEAVRNSWRFFQDDFWKGPKPTRDTVFSVRVSAREAVYNVKAENALAAEQKPLFAASSNGEAFDPK